MRIDVCDSLQGYDPCYECYEQEDEDEPLLHVGHCAQGVILGKNRNGCNWWKEEKYGEDLHWVASEGAIDEGDGIESCNDEYSPKESTAAAESSLLSYDGLRSTKTALHWHYNHLANFYLWLYFAR